MSSAARIILGVALVLIALGFLALLPVFAQAGDAFPPTAVYAIGFLAVFCGLGAVACFSSASHPVAIRIIGGTIFVVSLMYMASQVGGGAPRPGPAAAGKKAGPAPARRSQPSLINSLLFFVLVGLPSGYAAAVGRYPGWGAHPGAFGSGSKKKKRKRPRG